VLRRTGRRGAKRIYPSFDSTRCHLPRSLIPHHDLLYTPPSSHPIHLLCIIQSKSLLSADQLRPLITRLLAGPFFLSLSHSTPSLGITTDFHRLFVDVLAAKIHLATKRTRLSLGVSTSIPAALVSGSGSLMSGLMKRTLGDGYAGEHVRAARQTIGIATLPC
jgi:hypothetical protein